METYSYTAVAKDGKDKKGQIEAETRVKRAGAYTYVYQDTDSI